MNQIIPSIASANPLEIRAELERISCFPRCHLDIEDGNFIPNITFGMKMVRAIASVWKGELDAHLFTTNPATYIPALIGCGVSRISFQVEASQYPLELLRQIQGLGAKAGLALNPGTPLGPLAYALPAADYVLLMSSEPDGRGQEFLPHTYDRVRELRKMVDSEVEIWVDGGVDKERAVRLCEMGANVLIMGRAIFTAEDIPAFLKLVTDAINGEA